MAGNTGGFNSSPRLPGNDGAWAFPVVGIGASAGGLETLRTFLDHLGRSPGAAFVIVTHMDPAQKSLLADLLSKRTSLPVSEAREGQAVEPDHIYIIPPGRDLTIGKGALHLHEPTRTRGVHLPIDTFFRSLAEECGSGCACAVLSGSGSDGALGLKEVKGAGGVALVQDPEEALHDGMPQSALSTGMADLVLPVAEIPGRLEEFFRRTRKNSGLDPDAASASVKNAVEETIALIRKELGHDFSRYKRNTIHRRIEKRILVRDVPSHQDYLDLLKENRKELEELKSDLLIGVTSFFRDPEAFEVLVEKVLPEIFRDRAEEDTVRVWAPGCSTGEEAYTLAILIQEYMERAGRNMEVQIFATDVDRDALETARAGVYPESVVQDLGPERVRRWFRHRQGVYRVSQTLREMVLFAPHDLLSDPPFFKLDLVCCRNLLIYLDSDIQQKILPLFFYSLNPGGWLFLGPSESVGRFSDLFHVQDKKWKIFRRSMDQTRSRVEIPMKTRLYAPLRQEHRQDGRAGGPEPGDILRQRLLTRYARPAVLVNAKLEILFFSGNTEPFLKIPEGEPTADLARRARRGLRLRLRAALQKAAKTGETVTVRGLRVEGRKGLVCDVCVEPLKGTEETDGLLCVFFEERAPTLEDTPGEMDETEAVHHLEEELRMTGEQLQNVVEELESANEDLKASNEELVSMNEELQSSNEELETSQEELQALNEELSTVNAELSSKVAELQQAYSDIENFLAASNVATLFVDENLAIRRFTPAAHELFHLIPSDIGRPLEHLVGRVDHDDLPGECRGVLRDLAWREREVTSRDDRRFIMRIFPYRTVEDEIQGVVLTFLDVTELKRVQDELRKHQEHLEALVETRTRQVRESEARLSQAQAIARVGSFERNMDTGEGYWSDEFYRLLGYEPMEVENTFPLFLSHIHEVDRDMVRETIEKARDAGGDYSFDCRYIPRAGELRYAHAVGWVGNKTQGGPRINQGVFQDMTRIRKAEREIEKARNHIMAVLESTTDAFFEVDRNFTVTYVNAKALEVLHVTREQMFGKNLWVTFPDAVESTFYTEYHRAFEEQEVVEIEEYFAPFDTWYEVHAYPTETSLSVYFRDVTERKRHEQELVHLNERLTDAQRIAQVGDWWWDAESDIVTWSEELYRIMGQDPDQEPPSYQGQLDLYHPEDAPRLDEAVKRSLETGEGYLVELRRPRPDGTEIVVTAKGVALTNEAGKVVGLKGALQDVTERKRIEEELTESVSLLNATGRMAKVGGWHFYPETGKVTWTEETYRIHEVDPPHEPPLKEALEFFHPEDRPRLEEAMRRAAEDGIPYEMELRFTTARGRELWTRTTCEPEIKDGRVVCLRGTFQDITERRTAEEDLARVFSMSLDLICVADIETATFRRVNPAFTEVLGWAEAELLERPFLDFIHPDDLEETARVVEEKLKAGAKVISFENRYRHKDGGFRWLSWVSHPLPEFGVTYALARDVTEAREAATALRRAKERAETANRAKSEFLANMSHEIRTPLNGIMGMLQLLRISSLDQDQAKYALTAMESSTRLTRLLGDILDLSRVEAGRLEVVHKDFNLPDTLRAVEQLFRPAFEQKGVELSLDMDPDLPERVCGDHARLQQVLNNLIGNALKFTDQGRVKVAARPVKALEPEFVKVEFQVADTGMGIAEDMLGKLFEPFTQAEESYRRQHQGAGLGLTISRRLTELMGGELEVTSREGTGSVFYFTILFRPSGGEHGGKSCDPESRDKAVEPGRPLRILMAEDDRVSNMATTRLLEGEGHRVMVVEDGRQVLDALKKSRFDVVLMDIQMPVMDGVEATRAIRNEPEFAEVRDVPIVAMTAYAMSGDKERFLAEGMDDYVSKPVEVDKLHRILAGISEGSDED